MSSTVLEWSHILKLSLFLRTIEMSSQLHTRPLYSRGNNSQYTLPRNVSAPTPPVPVWKRWKSHLVHLLGIEPRFIFRAVRSPVTPPPELSQLGPSHSTVCWVKSSGYGCVDENGGVRMEGGFDKEFVCSKWRITYHSTLKSLIAFRFMQQWQQWHQSGMYVVTSDPVMFDYCAGFRLLADQCMETWFQLHPESKNEWSCTSTHTYVFRACTVSAFFIVTRNLQLKS